jgi:hypothetical protein
LHCATTIITNLTTTIASASLATITGIFYKRLVLAAEKRKNSNKITDQAALANPWVQSGIDLSQQGSALHVVKDANGGVKVDVDPALIARVEREGMSEIDPVIIGMRPADIQSLFGVKALTNTP